MLLYEQKCVTVRENMSYCMNETSLPLFHPFLRSFDPLLPLTRPYFTKSLIDHTFILNNCFANHSIANVNPNPTRIIGSKQAMNNGDGSRSNRNKIS